MRTTHLLAAVLAAVAAVNLVAQTPPHLVGITRAVPALRHHDHFNCTTNQCAIPGMPPAAALPPYAGGTGWDPVRSAAWVTNGLLLAQIDDNCGVQCPPMPIPGIGPNAIATGLEVVESQNMLLVLDSLGNLMSFTNTCPPNPINICNTGLMPGPGPQVTTGLAVDEGQGLVFMSYPDFGTGANWVIVSLLANPCQLVFRFQVPVCPGFALGPITGLGCDWCRQTLYVTDGINTVALRYVWAAPALTITNVNCCAPVVIPVLDPMIGLAVRPGRATSMGPGCANGACPPCPMTHVLRNDPNLGNLQFQLGLDNAPTGTLAWCLLGFGACAPAPVLPPLCGPLFIGPSLGNLGPVPTLGFGGCSGTANFNMGLPLLPAFCGVVLSSQCVAICSSAIGFGVSMSNCLSWQLQGN